MTNLGKQQRIALILALVSLVILLSAWASTYSASYETCQAERNASSAEQSDLRKEIAYFFVCEGVTVGVNGELITAIATAVIALFTITLWRSTHKQSRLTREAIDEAKKSSERQLRAYIAVEMAELVSDIGVGKPIEIQFAIKNYGQTPAYKCIASMNCIIWDYSGDKPMDLPYDLDPEPFGVFHPGHTLHKARISPPLTAEQVVGIATGTKAVWAFGQLTYETAFKIPRRTTKFRYILAKVKGLNEISKSLGISQYGNEAD